MSVFTRSLCLCTHGPPTHVSILLPKESTHFPIHLHESLCFYPAQHCCSLHKCICTHLFMYPINSTLLSLLPSLCSTPSSPALRLQSKEQSKITSHFLSFTWFLLPFLFFPPFGTVPFCKMPGSRTCFRHESFEAPG